MKTQESEEKNGGSRITTDEEEFLRKLQEAIRSLLITTLTKKNMSLMF